MTINCLHIIASLSKQHGGPSYSVTGLCDVLASRGKRILLVAQKTLTEQDAELVLPRNPTVELFPFLSFRKLRITYTPGYKHKLLTIVEKNQVSIIHNHGLWLQCNHQSAVVAARYDIPYIVSPRGMLEPWAFAFNSWKKKIVWWLWQKRSLLNATAFCATSVQEAENIRSLGFKQPIAIIPNGVDLPPLHEKQEQAPSTIRYALFLSRIHPKKGLLNLVKAWSQAAPEGWKVIIAGPDENGHQQELQNEIAAAGMSDIFEIIGPVEGERKEQLLRDAGLFILPTFSENFGIVVAEALAAGTPVITTKGTPWEGLVTHSCGWWIDIGAEPLADAIELATSCSDAERIAMGKRGREYVIREFGWDEIGRKTVSFYGWILQGGTPPDCVRLD